MTEQAACLFHTQAGSLCHIAWFGIDTSHRNTYTRSMAAPLQRLAHRFVLVLLLIALGLSPVLMQTVAWARMLMDYSRSSTFTVAVAMTFDGDHPCDLCQKVQKAQKEDGTDHKPRAL